MAEGRLYTRWNSKWEPMDWLEDLLSTAEAKAAPIFQKLQAPSYVATPADREGLCWFLGLQACRHPDVLNRSRRLAVEFVQALLHIRHLEMDDFVN